MRGLRQAKDFLRMRRGVQERKCLDCGKWLVESTGYGTQRNHGALAYVARCRPCNAKHRAQAAISSSRQPPAETAPLPKDPPPLTWDTFLRGLL